MSVHVQTPFRVSFDIGVSMTRPELAFPSRNVAPPRAERRIISMGLPKRALTSLRRPAQSTHLYLRRY
jgi:hypothetical protein